MSNIVLRLTIVKENILRPFKNDQTEESHAKIVLFPRPDIARVPGYKIARRQPFGTEIVTSDSPKESATRDPAIACALTIPAVQQ
jgi:hypothetical protein